MSKKRAKHPGDEISRLRASVGLSRIAFAELLGTSDVSVWRWENRERTPSEMTLRLARRVVAELKQEEQEGRE